jgi:hypothetical protein
MDINHMLQGLDEDRGLALMLLDKSLDVINL